jgi:hypothetical protein
MSLKIPKGGNQNLLIEEEQTTQWSKEKRTTNDIHTHKTKGRVTRTQLKTGGFPFVNCTRHVMLTSQ